MVIMGRAKESGEKGGPRVTPGDIAIVGMGCRLPGGANSARELWELLCREGSGITDQPTDRWEPGALDKLKNGGGVYPTRGGFLPNVELFDNAFFSIPDTEAAAMDPQQRVMLEVAVEAFHDAGFGKEALAGSRTGVFIGCGSGDWTSRMQSHAPGPYVATGASEALVSNRVSFALDLTGPSQTVNTASSSALVAVHQACRGLQSGDCDMALAGGVSIMTSPEACSAMSFLHVLSPDQLCMTFDAYANGYVRGEGCGGVVLKRLADATEADDTVLAVIRGSCVNHTGLGPTLTAPSEAAQRAAVFDAVAEAGVALSDVSYVEAHGTGTPLGDSTEWASIAATYGDPNLAGDRPLVIGAVKTNIGHAEGAAGIAGLIKAVLVLRHGQAPPNLNLSTLSPALKTEDNTAVLPPLGRMTTIQSRIGAVNSFGFGGANAHVILQGTPIRPSEKRSEVTQPLFKNRKAFKLLPALPTSAGSSLATELRGFSRIERHERLCSIITDMALSSTAGTASMDVNKPFMEVGVDSLALMELRQRLHLRSGIPVSSAALFAHPTVAALAEWLDTALMEGSASSLPRRMPPSQAGSSASAPLAVVGMACRFPGGADSPEAFWAILMKARDCISAMPPGRLAGAGKEWHGGFIDGVEMFDNATFGVSVAEAEAMDPTQRIMLEVGYEALHEAGFSMDTLRDSNTGVFVGAMQHGDWAALNKDGAAKTHSMMGESAGCPANRLSYALGLRGPSISVDTLCSSSLVALDTACRYLRFGTCDAAVVGGVNLLLGSRSFEQLDNAGFLSKDWRCKTFDVSANGYVRGEGCGAVVLKRLDDAERNGDSILAVVRGSSVNHNGRSMRLTAPSPDAQQTLIEAALEEAGVAGCEVHFVETHGTGTALGDPIEMSGLKAAYGEGREISFPLTVGAVKTNIGHLEGAAGIAGLLKTILTLQHRAAPGNLHLRKLNPELEADGFALFPSSPGLSPLGAGGEGHPHDSDEVLYAGVSSFGAGGTNAHVVLSSATLRVEGQVPKQPTRSGDAEVASPTHVFLFTGQGSQYLGMGKALYEQHDVFREAVHRCDGLLQARAWLDKSVVELMYPAAVGEEQEERAQALLKETRYCQPCLFVLEYALCELWKSKGVEPSVVMGHSLGEVVAACVAGVMSLEDGLMLSAKRGAAMQACPEGDGVMVAVRAGREATVASIDAAGVAGEVMLASSNGPQACVISGAGTAVAKVVDRLSAGGVGCKALEVSHAFHSPLMRPAVRALEEALRQVSLSPPRIPLVSNVTGEVVKAEEVTKPDYWVQHMLSPVLFAESVATLLREIPGAAVRVVEIGPSPVLTNIARQCAGERSGVMWQPSMQQQREESDATSFDSAVAAVLGKPLPLFPSRKAFRWYTPQTTAVKEDDHGPLYVLDWHVLEVPTSSQQALPTDSAPWLVVLPKGATEEHTSSAHGALDAVRSAAETCSIEMRVVEAITLREPLRGSHLFYLTSATSPAAEGASNFVQTVQHLGGVDSVMPVTVVTTGVYSGVGWQSSWAVGLVRSVRLERGDVVVNHVDLATAMAEPSEDARSGVDDTHAQAASQAMMLSSTPPAGGRGMDLLVRGCEILSPRLVPSSLSLSSAREDGVPCKEDGTYLISGGLGGLGLVTAKHLVSRGARHLLLLSRRGRAAEEVSELWQALQSMEGVIALAVACDVSDMRQLRAAVGTAVEGLPPIRGVIHAAGVSGAKGMISGESGENLQKVFAAKVQGGWNLHTLCLEWAASSREEVDFFVSYSSTSAFLGLSSQSAYAGANAALDGLMRYRWSQLGLPGSSVQWGPWGDVGMAARSGMVSKAAEMTGVGLISPTLGMEALDAVLVSQTQTNAQEVAVMPGMRWERFRASLDPVHRDFLGQLEDRRRGGRESNSPNRVNAEVREELLRMSESARRESIEHVLTDMAVECIGDDATVKATRPLMEAGLDSLASVEFRGRIEAWSGVPVSNSAFFSYPSVAVLAAWLEAQILEAPDAHVRGDGVLLRRQSSSDSRAPIAVVSMACRFPGGANSPEQLWSVLCEGRDCITAAPHGRWESKAGDAELQGGFIEGVEMFDNAFFGISAPEAEAMDPNQRIMLEVAFEALHSAGESKSSLRGSNTGVFVGLSDTDWGFVAGGDAAEGAYGGMGLTASNIANRVSYTLGLCGPSALLQTVCSSSLVALDAACSNLRLGKCDSAVVGGVNLLLGKSAFQSLTAGTFLSSDGRCKTFDASANGYVRGEGCGAVVLKPLDDALAAGDNVLAVIEGCAVNHNGASARLTAPSPAAQRRLIEAALSEAGREGSEVRIVEAHGTGTSLGDPIEMSALKATYGKNRDESFPLVVGAVKTNIGHLEGAAGLAGLIKAVLMLQHRAVPANLHLETINPELDMDGFHVRLPEVMVQLEDEGDVLVGVSSFGAGGTNAHVLLRSHGDKREGSTRAAHAPRHHAETPVGFLFTGQGSQYVGMGRELYEEEAVFHEIVERCSGLLMKRSWLDKSVVELMYPAAVGEEQEERAQALLKETHYCQPCLFVLEYALCELWKSKGVEPSVVMGHSLGEVVAACVAGVMSLEDGLMLSAKRGAAMQACPEGDGVMVAVRAGREATVASIDAAGVAGEVVLASSNGPQACVISGAGTAVAKVVDRLSADGVGCKALEVSHAFHSPLMKPAVRALEEALRQVSLSPPRIPLVSNVTGEVVKAEEVTKPDYWVEHMLSPVLFAEGIHALVDNFMEDGQGLNLVELGPNPVLSNMGTKCQSREGLAWIPSFTREQKADESFGEALGRVAGPEHPQLFPTRRSFRWYTPPLAFFSSGQLSQEGEGVRLSSPFSPHLKDLLKDHAVNKVVIIPGVTYIEVGVVAALGGTQLGAQQQVVLQGANFVVPLEVEGVQQTGAAKAHSLNTIVCGGLSTLHGGDGSMQFFGGAEGDRGTTARMAQVSVTERAEPRDPLDVEDIKGRVGTVDIAWSLYKAMADANFNYGPRFERNAHMFANDGEVLSIVRALDAELCEPWEVAGFAVHPAVLDNATHSILHAIPQQLLKASGRAPFLPVGFDEVVVFGGIRGERVWVHTRFIEVEEGGNSIKYDIKIADFESKQILVEMRGFRVQRARGFARSNPLRRAMYTLEWEATESHLPVELPPHDPEAARQRWLVAIAQEEGESEPAIIAAVRRSVPAGVDLRTRYGGGTDGSWDGDALLLGEAEWSRVLYVLIPGDGDGKDEAQGVQLARAAFALMALLRRLPTASSVPLTILTRGVQSGEDWRHSWVTGLVRTARMEHPSMLIGVVDLTDKETEDSELVLSLAMPATTENVWVRDEQCWRPQLVLHQSLQLPFALDLKARGSIANAFILRDVEVGKNQPLDSAGSSVEVAVRAVGLNFRDVLNVLDMYPGDPGDPCSEFAGEVISAGGDSSFHVGDAVFGFAGAGCLCSHVATSDACLAVMPSVLSFEQAAALPTVCLTVLRAFHDLKAGEKVLIHAAAGGVGLAAVQYAQRVGAEVYATAGATFKHNFLRGVGVEHIATSRDAQAFKESMGEVKVDVVLNSLSEDYISFSLDMLSEGGRFVEIGKRGVWSHEQMHTARPDVGYELIALDSMIEADFSTGERGWISGGLQRIAEECMSGAMQPLPVTPFDLRKDAQKAMAFLSQAKNIGKVVLTNPSYGVPVASDGTYVISGGLGALGLITAHHLAARGAQHLVLLSRSGRVAEEITEQWQQLLGMTELTVHTPVCDVADAEALRTCLGTVLAVLPPVRGVVHAAGVLDDKRLTKQTEESVVKVFLPKVQGAVNLHELSLAWAAEERPSSLDFFVCFTSMAGVLGNAGQANYAAANAAVDGLMRHRRRLGLAGTSLQWGPWADVGMAAQLDIVQKQLELAGVGTVSAELGMDVLDAAAMPSVAAGDVAVLPDMDWTMFVDSLGMSRSPSLLSELVSASAGAGASNSTAANRQVREELLGLSPGDRKQVVSLAVMDIAKECIGDGAEALDETTPLMEAGLDSLSLEEFRHRVALHFGVRMNNGVIYAHPTTTALTEWLAQQLAQQLLPMAEPPGAAAPPPPSRHSTKKPSSKRIAVVGMACRFPSRADDPDSFWANLMQEKDSVKPLPFMSEQQERVSFGACIEDADLFDNDFFGISAAEAKSMDPNQRLLLEVSYEALSRAGYSLDGPRSMRGSSTGVFVGSSSHDWSERQRACGVEADKYSLTGASSSAVAGRISHVLGLSGPCFAVDTACSSSLVALEAACEKLQHAKCDAAVVGGVNLFLHPSSFASLDKGGLLSHKGRMASFAASADGYVRAEGCGVVVLKRLEDAQGSNDNILGVIEGCATNHNGEMMKMGAPSGAAQEDVMRKALADAGASPRDVVFIEGHGTGSMAGDIIEMNAIKAVYAAAEDEVNSTVAPPLVVGVVKTNIGHMEGASSMGQLIKALLVLGKNFVPRNLHQEVVSPRIVRHLQGTRIVLARTPSALSVSPSEEPPPAARLAAVHSYGIGGTNAHCVLSGWKPFGSKTTPDGMNGRMLAGQSRFPARMPNDVQQQEETPVSRLWPPRLASSTPRTGSISAVVESVQSEKKDHHPVGVASAPPSKGRERTAADGGGEAFKLRKAGSPDDGEGGGDMKSLPVLRIKGVAAAAGASPRAPLLARAQQVATELGDKPFAFWYDGKGRDAERYTFKRMWDEAGKIAYMLREEWGVPKGAMVVLCYGPGMHFFAAFLGCLRAGVVAVMVYPPAPPLSKSLPKMSKIVADCKPLLCLTNSKIAALRKVDRANPLSDSGKLWPEALDFKATDGGLLKSFFSSSSASSSRSFDEPSVAEEDLAFLQYTSGSTGDPKGVMVTFGALMANVYLLTSHRTGMVKWARREKKDNHWADYEAPVDHAPRGAGQGGGSAAGQEVITLSLTGFSWLPQYHDMVLVVGLVGPFLTGMTMHYMSPVSFIKRPLLWLELISRHRVDWSIAPDFAYALCARYMAKVRGTRKEPVLDLSHVVSLCSSAEPIRRETIERFEEAFRSHGLPDRWFSSAYGLAEHVVLACSIDSLHRSSARPELTSVGFPSDRADLADFRIVNPDTMIEVSEAGATGEIWVCSPSVTAGYWGKPELSEETFGARLALPDGDGISRRRRYLRTGDLGFVEEGLLYICGRIKDLIILNGVNHYPQDVEFAVQEASDAIRQGCVAAFSSDETEGDGMLEVVFEIRREREGEAQAVMEAAQAALSSSFGRRAAKVVAIKQKTVPKTTSGKIRRRATRQALHSGGLQVVHELCEDTASIQDGAADGAKRAEEIKSAVGRSSSNGREEQKGPLHEANGVPAMATMEGMGKAAREALILERVVESARDASGNPGLRPTDRFMDAGLSSVAMAELAVTLEDFLDSGMAGGGGFEMETTDFFDFPTPALLAAHLEEVLFGRGERSARGSASSLPLTPLLEPAAADGDIAIVGMSCRFPGGCNSPEDLWATLCAEQDCVSEAPVERGLGPGIQGGFINGVDKFDNAFFGISEAEAEALDPSQRIMLETAYEALYRAGFDQGLESLHGQDVGVFIGKSGAGEWSVLQQERGAKQSTYSLVGASTACVAGRVSHTLGLTGTCFTIDAGCPSALIALETACNTLMLGKCSGAVVGGVNLLQHRQTFGALDKAGFLSKYGRCKSFDVKADGYVRAEGCGAVVLKRSADAKRDGDRILATIKAAAVSHNGVSSSLSAPKGVAQQSVAAAALSRAGYRGSEVSYVEAHATATITGDAIEMGALKAVYAGGRPPQSPLVVGTVKTTLGHMEGASGMAQLIKAILVLQHGAAPPNLHLKEVNPMLKLEGLPVVLPTQMTALAACCGDRGESLLVVGINSFGLGGFNAHIILEGRQQSPSTASTTRQEKVWGGFQTQHSFPLPHHALGAAGAAATKRLGAPGQLNELQAMTPSQREASVRQIVRAAVESVCSTPEVATDPNANVLEALGHDSTAIAEVVERVIDTIEGDQGDEKHTAGEGEGLRSVITPATLYDMPTLDAIASFISEACLTTHGGTARAPGKLGTLRALPAATREEEVRLIVLDALEQQVAGQSPSDGGPETALDLTAHDLDILEVLADDSQAAAEFVVRVVNAIEGRDESTSAHLESDGGDEANGLLSVVTPAALFDMPTVDAFSSFVSEACLTHGDTAGADHAHETRSSSWAVRNSDRQWQASDAHMPAERKAELGYTALKLVTVAAAQILGLLAVVFVASVLLSKVPLSVGSLVSGFPVLNTFQTLKLLEFQEDLTRAATAEVLGRNPLFQNEYLNIVLSGMLGAAGFLLAAMLSAPLVKWGVVGRYKAGVFKVYSWYHLRCWLVDLYLDYFFYPVVFLLVRDSVVLVPLYRLMGAKIGHGTDLTGVRLSEFDLVSIGENCSVAGRAIITPKSHIGGMRLQYEKVVIGSDCELGIGSVVHGGSELEDGVRLHVRATVPPGTRLAGPRVYQGSPATVVPRRSMPAPVVPVDQWMSLKKGAFFSFFAGLAVLPGAVASIAIHLNASNGINAGRYTGILLLFLYISLINVVTVCTTILLKWVLVGKLRRGVIVAEMGDWAVLCRETANRLNGLAELILVRFFHFAEGAVIYYRLLGASIHHTAILGGAVVLSDPDTIEMRALSFVGGAGALLTETSDGVLEGCTLERGATVGDMGIVGAGSRLETLALLTSRSWLGERMVMPPNSTGRGIPAGVVVVAPSSTGGKKAGDGVKRLQQKAPRGRVLNLVPGTQFLTQIVIMFAHLLRLFGSAVLAYEFLDLFQEPIDEWYAARVLESSIATTVQDVWTRFDTQTLLLPVAYLLYLAGGLLSSLAVTRLFGMFPEGSINSFSWEDLRYKAVFLFDVMGRPLTSWMWGTPIWPAYLNLQGADVSTSSYIETHAMFDPSFLTVGDGVTIAKGACLSPHTILGNETELLPIHIGHSVVLGVESRMVGGGVAKPGTIVGDNSRPGRGQVLRPPRSASVGHAGGEEGRNREGTWHFAGVPVKPFKATPYGDC